MAPVLAAGGRGGLRGPRPCGGCSSPAFPPGRGLLVTGNPGAPLRSGCPPLGTPSVWGLAAEPSQRGFALSLGSAWRVFFLHPDNSNLRLCVQEIIGIHLRGVWEESIALIFVVF